MSKKIIIAMLVLFIFACTPPVTPPVQKVDFTVTVTAKTEEHPYFGEGSDFGYAVNGEQGAELRLVRGRNYTFKIEGATNHPFYISTNDTGAGAGVYSNGVIGAPMAAGIITFSVPQDAPDLLWYQCMNHPKMGWEIDVVNSS